ncbi:hypothetical protein FB446DRAFT_710197, partial [Lentinula raphanica]
IAYLAGLDAEKVESGQLEVCRTHEQIEADIWLRPIVTGNTKQRHTILRAASTTLLNHLKTCRYQTDEASTAHSGEHHLLFQPHVISLNSPPLLPVSDSALNYLAAEDALSSMSGGSGSLAPSDSLSRAASRQRQHPDSFRIDQYSTWTADHQRLYEELLIRLTASAGLPLSWVDNLEFDAFISHFLPHAKPVRQGIATSLANCEVTMQADGWTGLNHSHLVAFMVSAERKIHTVDVYDTSKDRKTADEFLKLIQRCYKKVTEEWRAIPVAFVSDASGESRKARRLLAMEHPELAVLDCYAHQ